MSGLRRSKRLRNVSVRPNYNEDFDIELKIGDYPEPLSAEAFGHTVNGRTQILRYHKPLLKKLNANDKLQMWCKTDLPPNNRIGGSGLQFTYTTLQSILNDSRSAEPICDWLNEWTHCYSDEDWSIIEKEVRSNQIKIIKNADIGSYVVNTDACEKERNAGATLLRVTGITDVEWMSKEDWANPKKGVFDVEMVKYNRETKRMVLYKPKGLKHRFAIKSIRDSNLILSERALSMTAEHIYCELDRIGLRDELFKTKENLEQCMFMYRDSLDAAVLHIGCGIFDKLVASNWKKRRVSVPFNVEPIMFEHVWIDLIHTISGKRLTMNGTHHWSIAEKTALFGGDYLTRVSRNAAYLFFAETIDSYYRDSKLYFTIQVSLCRPNGVIVSSLPQSIKNSL